MSESDPISPDDRTQSFNIPELQSNLRESGLYIVSTPIGNLRDITLRALDILGNADMILAEDTRQTQKLLNHYDIKTPLSAYHDHNVAKRLPDIIKHLDQGKIIAQVSDAGTPLISDPGFKLVRASTQAGHKVYPIPGPSALLAGLVVAGLPTDRFVFAGFLPNKSGARKRVLEDYVTFKASLVFFESANRLRDTLSDIQTVLGDRESVIARELTKRYEDVRRGLTSELITNLSDKPVKGEVVLMVGPPTTPDKWESDDLDKALSELLPTMGVKDVSTHLAELSGWARRDIYQRALKLKPKT